MKLKLKEFNDGLSLTEVGSMLFGLIYISGYLVSALYVRSRGIPPLPLLKAQYIETGWVFLMLTGLIAAIPLLIVNMAVHGRVKHNQRITPTIVIPVIITTNFLLVFLFWAIFVTEFEWESSVNLFGFSMRMKQALPIYLLSMLTVLPALPIIRMADSSQKAFLFLPKLSSEIDNTLTSKRANVAVQSLRAVALAITLVFDCIIFRAIPWLPGFLAMSLYYVLTVFLLIGTIYLVRYLTNIFGESSHRVGVWAIAVPLLLSAYYFCATAYSYVVYNNIPVSRGGKYPTTKAVLKQAATPSPWPKEVYVLEETPNSLYAVSTALQNWFTSHEDVLIIPQSEVERLVHLSSGAPRVNHLRSQPAPSPTR